MKRNCMVIAVAALLAACGGMQQASLLYSSRVSGGLDISTAAADGQGLSFSLGYKSTDLAVVPVAVAASGATGKGAIDRLIGTYGNSVSTKSLESLPEEQKSRLTAAITAHQAASIAAGNLRSAEGQRRSAERAVAEALAASQPSTQQVAALQREQALVAKRTKELAEADEAAKAAAAAATEAIAMLQNRSEDALSVYGRFDQTGSGDTGASAATSGQLTVGRVFSTGVAAQHLTVAARTEARSACLVRFTTMVGLLTDAAKRAELALQVKDVCPPEAAN